MLCIPPQKVLLLFMPLYHFAFIISAVPVHVVVYKKGTLLGVFFFFVLVVIFVRDACGRLFTKMWKLGTLETVTPTRSVGEPATRESS